MTRTLLVMSVLVLSASAACEPIPTSGPATQPASRPAPLPAKEMGLDLGNGAKMKLVLIPAGTFRMGSSLSAEQTAQKYSGKARYFRDEHPQHTVKLTKAFYMGVTEVTQEQYEAVMGNNPSSFKGARNPVESVSWNDATAFCRKMSAKTGKAIRLPTEAEWEYACRAGTTTAYHWGDRFDGKKCNFADRNTSYAWSDNTVDDGHANTAPVGSFPANAWGLYDIHGNVWEWCQDWYKDKYSSGTVTNPTGPASGSLRVLRGGSWTSIAGLCRSADRFRFTPVNRSHSIGFRVVVSASAGLD